MRTVCMEFNHQSVYQPDYIGQNFIELNLFFFSTTERKQMYVDCSPYWYELRTFLFVKE